MNSQELTHLKSLQLIDQELKLVFNEKKQATKPDESVAAYYFDMMNTETGERMGFINIKAGYTDNIIQYRGNIGFAVLEEFKGNKYAARSCQLLKDVIKWLGLSAVYITCNVDNHASRKTIEAIGARFLESTTVDQDSPYYLFYTLNDRVKLRYIWDLEDSQSERLDILETIKK